MVDESVCSIRWLERWMGWMDGKFRGRDAAVFRYSDARTVHVAWKLVCTRIGRRLIERGAAGRVDSYQCGNLLEVCTSTRGEGEPLSQERDLRNITFSPRFCQLRKRTRASFCAALRCTALHCITVHAFGFVDRRDRAFTQAQFLRYYARDSCATSRAG